MNDITHKLRVLINFLAGQDNSKDQARLEALELTWAIEEHYKQENQEVEDAAINHS